MKQGCSAGLLLLFLKAVTLGISLAYAEGAARIAHLRTGDIELGVLDEADDLSAVTAATGSPAGQDAGSDPYSAWGDALGLRLYLVGHTGSATEALRRALVSRGSVIVSYVPDDTWLVAATPRAMREVVARTGAPTARYKPTYKVAPEWEQLGSTEEDGGAGGGGERLTDAARDGDVQAAADAGGGPSGGRRRLRAHSAAAGGVGNPDRSSHHNQLTDAPGSGSSSAEGAGTNTQSGGRLLYILDTLAPHHVAHHVAVRGRLLAGGSLEGEPRYGVSAHLLPAAPAEVLEAAEVDWPAALAAVLAAQGAGGGEGAQGGNGTNSGSNGGGGGCYPVVLAPRDVSSGHVLGGTWGPGAAVLDIYLCEKDLRRGVRWLARQPLVTWVAPRARQQLDNAFAAVLTQNGDITAAQSRDPLAGGLSARPYHAAGLDGAGEVVGVADSGLNLGSCYFADPRYGGTEYGGLAAGASSRLQLPEHRKVVQYVVAPGALYGDEAGHGTHVAGSVAGAQLPYTPARHDAATGAAPRARLSFVDGGSPTRFDLPKPLADNYFPLHTDAGAAIISDSWGSLDTPYNDLAAGYDLFLWRNPMVACFRSAGNYGLLGPLPGGTLNAESHAKSPVVVGATAKARRKGKADDVYLVRGSGGAAGRAPVEFTVYLRESEAQPKLKDVIRNKKSVPLVVAPSPNACRWLATAPPSARGAVVVVQREYSLDCGDTAAAQAVRQAGGLALAVVALLPLLPTGVPQPAGVTGLPCSLLPPLLGGWVVGNASAGVALTLTRKTVRENPGNVALYSSFGPTPDGRIKPDVVGPGGDIVSAASDKAASGGSTCSSRTEARSGTSMAAPLAAGHAALMRQYFRSGFYPDGRNSSAAATPFIPSGMLLKAVMIAGAKSLKGGSHVALGARLGAGPDGMQGFGRISLPASLPLSTPGPGQGPALPPKAQAPGMRLQVADMGAFTEEGQRKEMGGLTATGQGPVSVVLVWYDYPADPAVQSKLVNDLDLTVTLRGGGPDGADLVLLGNAGSSPGAQPDRVNTVERVLISKPLAGAALSITVSVHRLASVGLGGPDAQLPQRWAVAVVGHVAGSLDTELNPARGK